jgi:hypothetical protein
LKLPNLNQYLNGKIERVNVDIQGGDIEKEYKDSLVRNSSNDRVK